MQNKVFSNRCRKTLRGSENCALGSTPCIWGNSSEDRFFSVKRFFPEVTVPIFSWKETFSSASVGKDWQRSASFAAGSVETNSESDLQARAILNSNCWVAAVTVSFSPSVCNKTWFSIVGVCVPLSIIRRTACMAWYRVFCATVNSLFIFNLVILRAPHFGGKAFPCP